MASKPLLGKRCLVTGGTRGLGLAIAQELVRQGASKIAVTFLKNEKDAEHARAVLTALGAEPEIIQGSVCDPKHAVDTIKGLSTRWGGLDAVINNAGIMHILPLALIDEAEWDAVMDVNAKGAFLFSQAALRPMIKAKAGVILNIGNFASERIVDTPIHYATSKAALRGLTEALAKEVGRYGIRVNLLAPGILDEGMGKVLPQHRLNEYLAVSAMGRLARLDEVARFAAFLVSDESTFISGSKFVLDGGV